MGQRMSLAGAIKVVRDFFERQCGAMTLEDWHVLSSLEDMAKGAYVIRCVEKCFADSGGPRAHEVWVDPATGEITHTHRIETPKS